MAMKSQPRNKGYIGFPLVVQIVSIFGITMLPPASVCNIDKNATANIVKTPSPQIGQKTTSNFKVLIDLIHLVNHGCGVRHHTLRR